MAAVIRIKRSLGDDPLEAFVLNCKKRKICENAEENKSVEVSTVLKLAGTIDSEEKDIFKHIKQASRKRQFEDEYKKHVVDINAKLRLERQTELKNTRYKIVNFSRSKELNDECSSGSDQQGATSEVTVLDIEADINQNVSQTNLNDTKYVYDLYYTASDDLGDAEFDDVSILPFTDSLVYGSHRDNGITNDSDSDSEDSNAENYYTNDYPDESDQESLNEIKEAVDNMYLGDGLSSDYDEYYDYNYDYNDDYDGYSKSDVYDDTSDED